MVFKMSREFPPTPWLLVVLLLDYLESVSCVCARVHTHTHTRVFNQEPAMSFTTHCQQIYAQIHTLVTELQFQTETHKIKQTKQLRTSLVRI